MDQQAKFEGWAVVELFGHAREIGYVTTQYFGGAAMFQVDVPELPEREYTTKRPGYVGAEWAPAGSVVKKAAVPARSRLVGPSAVYSMNPCTEEFAREAIEASCHNLAVVSMPVSHQLTGNTENEIEPESHDEDEEVELPV